MDDRDGTTSTLEGVVTGAATAALVAWTRHDDDVQRKLRSTTNDSRSALSQLRELDHRGEMIRSRMPVIQDAQAGLSIAQQDEQPPTLTPSTTVPGRPDLARDMEESIAHLHWPPKAGVYTDSGYIKRAGEMATLFSALTFQEVRAVLQALVQKTQPTADQKRQVSRAFNSLIAALYGTNLTWQQFLTIWTNLFGGAASTNPSDPHSQTNPPPTVGQTDRTVGSVIPLGTPELSGYGYEHQNTDRASKWRINTTAGGPSAGTLLFQVNFGSPWMRNGKPYQPVVLSQNTQLSIINVTNRSFQVSNVFAMPDSSVFDVGFSAISG